MGLTLPEDYLKIILMSIQTISIKQLREDFDLVKQAMNRGQSLLLLYRSQPLAKIQPVVDKAVSKLRSFSQRQLKQWIKDDQLTSQQQARIDSIIERIS